VARRAGKHLCGRASCAGLPARRVREKDHSSRVAAARRQLHRSNDATSGRDDTARRVERLCAKPVSRLHPLYADGLACRGSPWARLLSTHEMIAPAKAALEGTGIPMLHHQPARVHRFSRRAVPFRAAPARDRDEASARREPPRSTSFNFTPPCSIGRLGRRFI